MDAFARFAPLREICRLCLAPLAKEFHAEEQKQAKENPTEKLDSYASSFELQDFKASFVSSSISGKANDSKRRSRP
jgi:hypothetical protein